MELHKIGSYIILACFLLAFMPAMTAAASGNTPAPSLPLPNLLQEKSKLQYNQQEFLDAGTKEGENGNYEEAIKNYNKAEEIVVETQEWNIIDGRAKRISSDTMDRDSERNYKHQLTLEKKKAQIYKKMPGHEKEAAAADQEVATLQKRYDELQNRDMPTSLWSCLIATATFGSPMAPQVQQLREFREGNIYSTKSGTQFMTAFNTWYYSFSPAVGIFIDQHPSTKPPMRIILTPLLGILSLSKMSFLALSIYPDIAVIVSGFVASTLIGMVYVFPVLFVLLVLIRRIYPLTFTTGVFKILGGFTITGLALLVFGDLISINPVLLVGSVLFIVSLVLLTGLLLSWVCINRLDLRSAHVNEK